MLNPAAENPCTRRPRTLAEAVRSNGGALDLASIMVGVLVIGAFAGIVAATVFAVIPWAQDQAAKSSLDTVEPVETATKVLNGDFEAYDSHAGSEYQALETTDPGIQESNARTIIDADPNGWVAVTESATDKVYATSSANPNAVDVTEGNSFPSVQSAVVTEMAAAVRADQPYDFTRGGTRDTTDLRGQGPGNQAAAAPPASIREFTEFSSPNLQLVRGSSNGGLLAGSDGSRLFTSDDNARSWTPGYTFPTSVYDLDVSGNGTKMVAAVAGNQIVVSSNIGTSWTTRTVAAGARVYGVRISENGNRLLATGQSSTYERAQWTSTDNGVSWTSMNPPKIENGALISFDMSADGSKIVANGSRGLVLSVDGGATWRLLPVNSEIANVQDVAISGNGKTIAGIGKDLDFNSRAFVSHDGGLTFSMTDHEGYNKVVVSANGRRISLFAPEVLTTSHDGGVTWQGKALDVSGRIIAASSDGLKLAIVSQRGTVSTNF